MLFVTSMMQDIATARGLHKLQCMEQQDLEPILLQHSQRSTTKKIMSLAYTVSLAPL